VEITKKLLIRADANVTMGTGHVMRMLALAQAWQENGGEAVFLCAEITAALKTRLHDERFRLQEIIATPGSQEDLTATCDLIAGSVGQCIVALDGYQFDADYQLAVKNAGCRLLVMDDYGHCSYYHADWVLNQNISAREDLYACRSAQTHLLLGPRYALLRNEFSKYRGWKRDIPEVAHKVLVTLGGADSDNVSSRILESIAPLELEVKIVVGGSNPNLRTLQETVERCRNQPAQLELVINPGDMPGLMAWAEVAIAAGGSTAWELAFMRLPSLFVILAENQVEIAKQLEVSGLGICLGDGVGLPNEALMKAVSRIVGDHHFRQRLSDQGRQTVDGLGAARVASNTKNLQSFV
jgi:UDP-2,4-diacetamido-2,4,6-trideoxy-beta-L-altropyranose hydrolase